MKQVVWIPQAQRRLFPLRVQLGHTVTHLSAQSKPCSVPQDTSSAHRKGSAQFSANPYQVKKRTPSRLPCPKKRDLKYPIEGGRREERNKALHKRWGPVNTCWKGVILGKSQRSPLGQVLKGEKKEIVSRQFAPTGSKLFSPVSRSSLARAPSTQARAPFPNPCPPRDRGGCPRCTLSARPSSAPPEQGNVPPRSTSPHLAKALGPALRGKKSLVCGLFASALQLDILGLKPRP